LHSLAPDIVFFPTARIADCAGLPTAVMVRNMEPLAAPFRDNPWSVRARNVARRLAARRSCERATRVIAVSRYVADFLTEHWSIPARQVGLVYHGVEQGSFEALRSNVPDALAGLDPTNRWLFTAGSIRPARGLSDLLLALPHIPNNFGPLTLVIAGSPDPGVERHYNWLRELAAAQHRVHVLWAGQLDSAAMRWCMGHADLTVLTTRAEACPNIALEALAHGALTLAADTPPLPEFLGDTAVYYKAGRPENLAVHVCSLLRTLPARREHAAERARARARAFTWDATVEQTVKELQTALRR
jgi:glycosyltransferase involved in cell wall biosynthesis